MLQTIRSFVTTVSDLVRGGNSRAFGRLTRRGTDPSAALFTVVGLVESDHDRRLLAGTSSRNQWTMFFSATREEARAASDQLKAPIILYDRDQPGMNWQEVMEYLASSAHRPCIILTSTVIDGFLWKEVVRRGGYDVLAKPLREDEVIRVVKLAWSYWNSAARTVELPVAATIKK